MTDPAATKKARVSFYQQEFQQLLLASGKPDWKEIDPRHVEAYLRLTYRVLDSLSQERIKKELPSIVAAIQLDPQEAEDLAKSYGL